jgi:uncharacterized membrane protein YidH (DUF202 family)
LTDTGLADERTQLAWQRTGLSHVALGALSLRLLPTTPLRPAFALSMILVGAITSVGARRMHAHEPHRRWIAFLGIATPAAALAAVALSFG